MDVWFSAHASLYNVDLWNCARVHNKLRQLWMLKLAFMELSCENNVVFVTRKYQTEANSESPIDYVPIEQNVGVCDCTHTHFYSISPILNISDGETDVKTSNSWHLVEESGGVTKNRNCFQRSGAHPCATSLLGKVGNRGSSLPSSFFIFILNLEKRIRKVQARVKQKPQLLGKRAVNPLNLCLTGKANPVAARS